MLALRYILDNNLTFNAEEEAAKAYYRQIFKMDVHSDDDFIEPLHSYNESFYEKHPKYRAENITKHWGIISERKENLAKCPIIPPALRK